MCAGPSWPIYLHTAPKKYLYTPPLVGSVANQRFRPRRAGPSWAICLHMPLRKYLYTRLTPPLLLGVCVANQWVWHGATQCEQALPWRAPLDLSTCTLTPRSIFIRPLLVSVWPTNGLGLVGMVPFLANLPAHFPQEVSVHLPSWWECGQPRFGGWVA